MIDQRTTGIEPPPTLDDILSHSDRIGRVDFNHRLVPEPAPEPEPELSSGSVPINTSSMVHSIRTVTSSPSASTGSDHTQVSGSVAVTASDPSVAPTEAMEMTGGELLIATLLTCGMPASYPS